MSFRRGALRRTTSTGQTLSFDVTFDGDDCQVLCELSRNGGFLVVDQNCKIRMKGLWEFSRDLPVNYKKLSFGELVFFNSRKDLKKFVELGQEISDY